MSSGRKTRKKQFQEIYGDEDYLVPEISLNLRAKAPKLQQLPDKAERRQSPRYALEMETVIFCRGTSFRTRTCNLSLTGALLADNSPGAYVGQPLDVVLIRKIGRSSEYYLLKGKALGAPMRSPRLQFQHLNDTIIARLNQIFQEETPVKD